MIDPLDLKVLEAALVGLGVFTVAHIPILRWLAPQKFGVALKLSGILGLAACLLFSFGPAKDAGLLGAAAASLLYALLAVHLISLIFGMGETAVRIRLLFELLKRPGRRATMEEILRDYNSRVFIGYRLARMTGGGQLRVEGGVYRLNSLGAFRLQVIVIQALGWMLGKTDVW